MTVELVTWQDYTPGDPDVCVWCGASGCSIKSIEVQHEQRCPSVNGMWPVMPDQSDYTSMMSCSVNSCDHMFTLGEYYALVPDKEDPDIGIVVCIPCSFLHRNEAWVDRT